MFYQEILKFSHHLCEIASEISRHYYRMSDREILQEIAKDDDSPVTIADREIEQKIRQKIMEKYPDHGIVGEEFGDYQSDAEFLWIIDPIDGTSSFIVGRPIFGNLIAFAKQQPKITISNDSYSLPRKNKQNNKNKQKLILDNYKVLIGITNQPIINERWIGIDKECGKDISGSWMNNKRIYARECNDISQAVLCTSSPVFFQGNDAKIFKKICKQTKYQRLGGAIYGGDCYSYGCLASGFIDIIIEPQLKIYDFASHIPLIKNCSAIITDWQGKELTLQHNAKLLACSSKVVHQQILNLINN